MARLLIVLLAVGAVLALGLALVRAAERLADHSGDTTMPDGARTISYVLLILLMFGVVTGWLGGL